MEILLAVIFGAAYGGILHFAMGGRDLRGAALAPLLGSVIGGLSWLAMTWSGATTTDPWIWLVSLAAPAVIVPLVLALLTRLRKDHDTRERTRLGI